MFCKATKFASLPCAGGVYDQDPKLIEEWDYIIRCENIAEKRRQDQDRVKNSSAARSRRR